MANANAQADAPKYAEGALIRPEALANDLGISGKVVRAYLRATFPRPIEAKGTTWVLTAAQANATYAHFVARRSPVEPVEAAA